MIAPADRLIAPELDARDLRDLSLRPVEHPGRWSLPALVVSGLLVLAYLAAIVHTVMTGIGAWGNRNPVNWAFAITNFVWWIGIGHAGTFISAIALLLNQGWRTSVNRIAETMTLLALVNAGLFPLLHLGRSWFFYWLVPYPAVTGMWPQFTSSLTWDVAAITTYSLVSLLFWYLGMLPDLAVARDTARGRLAARCWGVLSLGWRGAAAQWRRPQAVYRLLAAIATPLVISVHSIVSLDFAIAKLPGWASTIFPPYFVAGALLSGFAMVLILVVPLRRIYRWQGVITPRHLDALASLLLVSAMVVAYTYLLEAVLAWWSGDVFEIHQVLVNRHLVNDAWLWWSVIIGNAVLPQLLWLRRCRRSPTVLILVSLAVLAAMWGERFIIVITTLEHAYLPAAWDGYAPTITGKVSSTQVMRS